MISKLKTTEKIQINKHLHKKLVKLSKMNNKSVSEICEWIIEDYLIIGYSSTQPIYKITKKQNETIKLVVEGKTNSEISKILNIPLKTVEHRLSGLYKKFGVENRQKLAFLYLNFTFNIQK